MQTISEQIIIVIFAVLLLGFVGYKRHTASVIKLYSGIAALGKGKLSRRWGIFPVSELNISGDKAFSYYASGLYLWVESEGLKKCSDIWLTEGLKAGKRILTGNKEFDDMFHLGQHTGAKQTKQEVLDNINPLFQESLINLKREMCRQIRNRFVEIRHCKSSIYIKIGIENYLIKAFMGKIEVHNNDIAEVNNLLSRQIEVYKALRSAGVK